MRRERATADSRRPLLHVMVEGRGVRVQTVGSAGGIGGVGGQEVFQGGDYVIGLYFVETVAPGDIGAVRAAEDADVGKAEGKPFDWTLPGGADDHHRDVDGTADVHGAGIERDGGVAEGKEGGELGDGGLACERGADLSGGAADLLDGLEV